MNMETKIIWWEVQNGPNYLDQLFFGWNNCQFLLDIIAVYYHIQNQRNLNDSKSRKYRTTPDLGHLGPFYPILGQDFCFENRASSLFLTPRLIDAKKLRNLMVGSMRILRYGQTDRQTDGWFYRTTLRGSNNVQNIYKNIEISVLKLSSKALDV